MSALLMALTLVPYAWAFAASATNSNWQFMGILSNPQDGATYLTKIGEGERGQWLFTLNYTSEPSDGTVLFEFYLVLGQIGRVLNLTPLVIFHLARIAAGFGMYLAFYHLGATIWQRLRARRLFFGLLAVGSGIGWLALLIAPALTPTDLYVPESVPFYAAYANPHFPVAITLLALLTSTFVKVFRPGYTFTPTVENGGLAVAIIIFFLALTEPYAWVPVGATLIVYLAIRSVRTRRLADHECRWVALAILPALPVIIYDWAINTANPLYRGSTEQIFAYSGSPLNYLLGFAPLLIIALPGLVRAARQFEQDGDQLMFVWLIVNAFLLYAPTNLQRRFVIGMVIPIIYFAVRSLEEYWLPRIRVKQHRWMFIAVFALIVPSNALALILPLAGIVQPLSGEQSHQLLTKDYNQTLSWLNDHATVGSVVLAPPEPSLWIPAYSPAHVVYGHPFETVDAAQKLQKVQNWYAGQNCLELLSEYHVNYVLIGPEDAGLNPNPEPYTPTACAAVLGSPLVTFGNVSIYAAPGAGDQTF